MVFIRIIFITIFFLPQICLFAQQKNDPVARPGLDSLKASLEKRMQETMADMRKNILDTGKKSALTAPLRGAFQQPGLRELWMKNGTGNVKALGQPVVSKLKLFEKEKFLTAGSTNLDLNYAFIRDTSAVALGMLNSMNGALNYNAGTGMALFAMPFEFSFRGTNGLYDYTAPSFDQLLQFNFDHAKYVESIRSKVLNKLEPEKVLANALNRINQVRENYEKMLMQEIQSLKNNFAQEYGSKIDLPEGITDLTQNDLSSLKSKLLNQAELNNYRQKAANVQELLKSKNIDQIMEDSLYRKHIAGVKRFETLEKIYKKIADWKGKFENNTLVNNLRENLPFTKSNYASFLSKPANLEKVLEDHIDLNFIQRLFFNITKLDLGQNPVQEGEYSLQNLINTGMNMEFRNRKATVGMIYGKNNNINSWLQSGLTSPVTNEFSRVSGFKLGTGSASALNQFITVNLFEFNNFLPSDNRDIALQSGVLGMPQRRDATISFHSGYTFSGKHTLSVDFSKSFGSYVNNLTADTHNIKSNAYSNLFSQAGQSNFAAMVNYTGEIGKSDVKVTIKKTGMGYNNPGNTLSRAGETQLGFGIARRLLKQKLNLRYSVNYRRQNFDPLKRYRHTTINNKLQVNYRINRYNRVGLSYYRSDFDSRLFAGATTGGSNVRLQADGAYSFRIAGKKITNNVTLSHQRMQVPILADKEYKNNSLLLMHSSVTVIRKNPLTLMIMWNKSDNKEYLFNTSMFSTEVNYNYAISKAIRIGNALGYYANAGWNRQLGLKQQVSAVVFEKMYIDIDFMYKKAVQTIRPELANQVYISSGLRYNF